MSEERVGGIARYARGHGWNLMTRDRLGYNPLAWEGDGVVATIRNDPATLRQIQTLARKGVAVVDLADDRPDVAVPRVASDHEAIGRLAAAHFAERNYRNVAWFSLSWGRAHALRCRGLFGASGEGTRWVLSEALPQRRRNSWPAFSAWLGGRLASARKPLAVLCYDEADAARLLYVAGQCGLAVPEDVAILSIGNNLPICENQSVPLSSIDQNLARGGYEAAALLDRLMSGEAPPAAPVLIPPAGVVLRRSTDAVAASDPLVKAALAQIGANITRRFGVAQIATALGTTPSVLHKRFVAELGHAAGAEISRQRLALARRMLEETEDSASEIAAAAGYCTPSHLSNAFRAAMGVTPGKWRALRNAEPKAARASAATSPTAWKPQNL